MTTYPIGRDTMPYIRKRNSPAATKRRRLHHFGPVRWAIHIWNTWR